MSPQWQDYQWRDHQTEWGRPESLGAPVPIGPLGLRSALWPPGAQTFSPDYVRQLERQAGITPGADWAARVVEYDPYNEPRGGAWYAPWDQKIWLSDYPESSTWGQGALTHEQAHSYQTNVLEKDPRYPGNTWGAPFLDAVRQAASAWPGRASSFNPYMTALDTRRWPGSAGLAEIHADLRGQYEMMPPELQAFYRGFYSSPPEVPGWRGPVQPTAEELANQAMALRQGNRWDWWEHSLMRPEPPTAPDWSSMPWLASQNGPSSPSRDENGNVRSPGAKAMYGFNELLSPWR